MKDRIELPEENENIKISAVDEEFETLNSGNLNKLLAEKDENLSAQDVIKLYYPEEVEIGEGNEKIEISEKKLENGNTLVTLIHNNLLDDSLKGEKYIMELNSTNDKWNVISIKKNWKCRLGRGHTDWGVKLCM